MVADLYRRLARGADHGHPSSRWTTPPGSPRPSRTGEPGSPAATASVCSTCCSPRASTSVCARWPRPRPRTVLGADAHRPLARGRRRRSRPSVGRRRRGPGRATDGRLLGHRAGPPPATATPATGPNPASSRTRTSPTGSPRSPSSNAHTGGFTDHVFAACSILGCAFVPRIRDPCGPARSGTTSRPTTRAAAAVDAYVEAGRLEEPKAALFQTMDPMGRRLTGRALARRLVLAMI